MQFPIFSPVTPTCWFVIFPFSFVAPAVYIASESKNEEWKKCKGWWWCIWLKWPWKWNMQEAHFPTFNDCIGSGHFQDELTSLTFQSRWGAARDCNVNKILSGYLRKKKRVHNAKGKERTQDISGYLTKRKRVHIQCWGRGVVEHWTLNNGTFLRWLQLAPICFSRWETAGS